MTKPEDFEIVRDSPHSDESIYASFDRSGDIDLQVECENRGLSGQEGIAIFTLNADQAEALANWLLSAAAYSRSGRHGL